MGKAYNIIHVLISDAALKYVHTHIKDRHVLETKICSLFPTRYSIFKQKIMLCLHSFCFLSTLNLLYLFET